MPQELLSIAFVRPEEGKEEECLTVLWELYRVLHRKNYSRDVLYRDKNDPQLLVNLRYWQSPGAREQAHEDPEVHRHWSRLGQLCRVELVREELESISLTGIVAE